MARVPSVPGLATIITDTTHSKMAPSVEQNGQTAPKATSSPLPDKQQETDRMIEKLGDVIKYAVFPTGAPCRHYRNTLDRAIEAHPLFTPPKPQQTLFFMWDFVQRSRHMLQNLPSNKRKAEEQFDDVVGRCIYTKVLISDSNDMLAMMTGVDPKNAVDFGDDVRRGMDEVNKVTRP